jgi:two-component system sensor histidine kinase KdpD
MARSLTWRERLTTIREHRILRSLAGDGRAPWRFAAAALAVVLASLVMLPFREQLGVLNVMLLLLLLSFVLGLSLGGGPASLGAILAFLAFDYLFLVPYYTFTVARRDHVLGLFVYLAIAIAAARIMDRLRARTSEALRDNRRTSLLYDLNRALVRDVTVDRLLRTISESVVQVYGAAACRVLAVNDDGALAVRAVWPPETSRGVDRQAGVMAQWAIERRTPAGLSTAGRRILAPHGTANPPRTPLTRRGLDVLYIPIATPERVPGVLEISGKPGGGRFSEEDERILTSFADQAALALERTRLTEEAARAAVLEQSDALKSALLAAVSHDLRTPLTAIKASASALLDRSVPWTDDARSELLETIDEETDRLTQMVSNLLDLSRIEGGALRPDRDWYDLAELIDDTARRMPRQCERHAVNVEIEPGVPLLYLDYVQIAQVLVNLIGNACKYAPPNTPVVVEARRTGDNVEVRVIDRGPGIEPASLPHIFETFYRAPRQRGVSGSGIGLSICKGLVEAHGGTIRVESQVGEGTTMIVSLPIEERAA